MLGGIIDRIASEEIGAGTGFGISAAIVAHPRAQVKPMVVHDGIDINGQVEPPAQHGCHLDDGVALFGSHVISSPVKIPKMLQADRVGVLPIDAGRHPLHRPTGQDGPVRECGEMLANIRPSVGTDMVVFHGLLSLKMISPIEVGIVGVPGMVLLNAEDGPSDSLLSQPSSKLGKGHFCKSMSTFHK